MSKPWFLCQKPWFHVWPCLTVWHRVRPGCGTVLDRVWHSVGHGLYRVWHIVGHGLYRVWHSDWYRVWHSNWYRVWHSVNDRMQHSINDRMQHSINDRMQHSINDRMLHSGTDSGAAVVQSVVPQWYSQGTVFAVADYTLTVGLWSTLLSPILAKLTFLTVPQWHRVSVPATEHRETRSDEGGWYPGNGYRVTVRTIVGTRVHRPGHCLHRVWLYRPL